MKTDKKNYIVAAVLVFVFTLGHFGALSLCGLTKSWMLWHSLAEMIVTFTLIFVPLALAVRIYSVKQ